MHLRLTVALFATLGALSLSRGETLVQFRTSVGDMDVILYDEDKPVTASNFVRYVEEGAYEDSIFHRATASPGLVVIQGGYHWVSNRTSQTNFVVYNIPTRPPITNEFTVGTFHSNVFGTIAMAKSRDPDSARSQFFFNLGDNSTALDSPSNSGGFTVFGHVVQGSNVLNRLNAAHTNSAIQIADLRPYGPSELPVLKTALPPLEADEMIYVDISLLEVRIESAGGAQQISWNSVSNRTNIVEYTTALPPEWQTLVTTNGNGSRLTVFDHTPADASRFYRVRVLY